MISIILGSFVGCILGAILALAVFYVYRRITS
jgi:hypothetical protein